MAEKQGEQRVAASEPQEKKAIGILVAPTVTALEQSIEQADKYLKALGRIRKMAIQLTNYTDWVDQNGKPYLEAAGCSKIAGAFGIRTADVKRQKELCTDDKGDYLRFTVEGSGEWHTSVSHEIGSASTRDDFFARRKNRETGEEYRLPLSEIDLGDVEKKSFTNFMNRLIKRLVGLSFTWEEIEQYSNGAITRAKCGEVKYASGKRGGTAAPGAAATGDRAATWKQLLEMGDGEDGAAAGQLEKLTTYQYQGKTINGKRDIGAISDKSFAIVKAQVAKLYAQFQKTTASQGGGDEPPPHTDNDK